MGDIDPKLTVILDFHLHERARPNPLPGFVAPMLAVPADGSFTHKGWIYEPKLDGMRALSVIKNGTARMYSRRGLEITRQYPKLASQLASVSAHDLVIDGEIIALDKQGKPSFQQLQQRMNLTKTSDIAKLEKIVPVFYFVFDILHVGGFDLSSVPLRERKRILKGALLTNAMVQLLDHFEDEGDLAYDACIQNGFEGIVAKRLESGYEIGRRSPSWVKVKAQQTEDFVIGGYTEGQGSRGSTFGALLLGYHDENGKLVYCGSVGSGFDAKLLDDMMRVMTPLQINKCPFLRRPIEKKDVVWLAPNLVVEVKFMDRTRDGHLRAPVFLRLRDEIAACDVIRVEVVSAEQVIRVTDAEALVAETQTSYEITAQTPEQESLIAQLDQRGANLDLIIGGNRVSVTNLDRELWRSEQQSSSVTKRHYLRYLAVLAHLILPHMQGRPLTLIRLPYGVKGRSFYQRHWKAIPEFVDTVKTMEDELLFCNNLSSLIWFAQNRVLEFHSWTSRLDPDFPEYGGSIGDEHLINPDYLIVDIDVHGSGGKGSADQIADENAFHRARQAAFLLRAECEKIALMPFVKTSGRSGLHIFIPVHANLDFGVARTLATTICTFTANQNPDFLSIEMQPNKRGDRVFLDSSPNGKNRTVCAVYSARANVHAGVSTPITWEELEHCNPEDFTIHSMIERIEQFGDVWSRIFHERRDLRAMIGKVSFQ